MADMDEQIRAAQQERLKTQAGLAALSAFGGYDQDIYGGASSGDYVSEIPADDRDEMDGGDAGAVDHGRGRGGSHPASRAAALPERAIADTRRDAAEAGGDAVDPMQEYRTQGGSGLVNTRIVDREDSYHARRRGRALSPERGGDAFSGATPARSYAEIMKEAQIARERAELVAKLDKQRQEGVAVPASAVPMPPAAAGTAATGGAADGAGGVGRKRRRWDDGGAAAGAAGATPGVGSGGFDASDAASVRSHGTVGTSASTLLLGGGAGGGGSVVSGASDGLSVARASATGPYQGAGAGAGGATGRRSRFSDAPAAEGGASATPAYGSGGSVLSGRGGAGEGAAASAAAAAARSSRWGDSPEHAGSASTAAGFDSEEEEEEAGGLARKRAGGGAGVGAGAGAAAASTGGRRNRWDETPAVASGGGFGAADEEGATPAAPAAAWETPHHPSAAGMGGGAAGAGAGAGLPRAKRSRWDETPAIVPGGLAAAGATPALLSGASATPMMLGSGAGGVGATPTPGHLAPGAATPALGAYGPGATPGGVGDLARSRAESEMDARNRPLGDDELDAMFPPGYKVLEAPASYVPIRTPSRKLMATPTPMGAGAGGATGFRITDTPSRDAYGVPLGPGDMPSADGEGGSVPGGDLPAIRPEELQYFGKLLERDVVEEELSLEEQKERQIMRLLLKIKGGTPPQRKAALRQIADKARYFGAGPLFNQLLPLMISPSLEDLERHLLVKVIDRVLFRLDELVRPYVHKILAVIEPMLIDEDYYARVEGREIIANLAKAAGLATMISTMRPDIDHAEEYVRNITSRAFAVVGSALGIPAMLPFLKAVAASKKSWQARHTGVKIVQQIAILMGVSVLPHLRLLVGIVAPSLKDDQAKVRMMGALAIGALAEASHPYGFEAFDEVLRPLWEGIRQQRGKNLAAFLKAIGCLIPLMEAEYAGWYTREIMPVVVREFASPEEEMRRIVLKVVKQCAGTAGVTPEYVRSSVLPDFFKHFWVRRMAYDRRSYRAVVDTTLSLAEKVGAADIISQVVEDLKDDAEPYRRMVVETVDKVVSALGASDVNPRLEEQLMDGLLYAFQEQAAAGAEEGGGGGLSGSGARVILNGFGTVVAALGGRCKPYLPQIAGTIKWRLNNKSPQVRMEAADLVGRVAGVMKLCGEDGLLGHLGVVLYECLGEEYPEVLGSILGGLKSIVNVIGMASMQPPVKDLLPRLTPILKNRQERVQENCIDLVGRIADRGAEHVSPKEWMRICFDLLEMLRAPKKAIRRACVNTFGYIAKAIGPQDVLHALLNNLKVQERTMRVCTTIAIAIVAETCQPYTVLPALLNEYRIPDLNVQNGVLKALSFMFEYIGELSRDYVYAVVPLLEDALMERDPVHRQTAMFAVKHLALGLQGLGCEDALQHLLNYIWPNVFETLPHVILSFFESVEAMRVSLGPHVIMQYLLQGLFHPARKVREPYWKVYNNLYVYAADALTPLYPSLPDEGYNRYTRTYLELVV